MQAVQKEMLNVRAGSSANPEENRLRGVFTDAHASRVVDLVQDALQKGANVVVGDPDQAGKYEGGNIIQPFVLDHVTPEMGTYLSARANALAHLVWFLFSPGIVG